MIGDPQARDGDALELQFIDKLAHVAGQRGNAGGLVGKGSLIAEHEAVILHARAAARRVDNDMVEAACFDLARPGFDVPARKGMGLVDLAEMMRQRSATSGALGHDDLDAMAREETHGGFVDARVEHGLRATIQQRDAHRAGAMSWKNLRAIDVRRRWQIRRRKSRHRAQVLGQIAGKRLGGGRKA